MDNKKVGISLRNYIYKEGYTKRSFCKFVDINYNNLNLIIEDKFIDEVEYNNLLTKILHKINLNKEDLVKNYYSENIREEQIKIIKNSENNIFKLSIEQREILINLLESEVLKKERIKEDYELSEEKPWRAKDLGEEIKNLEDIVSILKNIIVIN